jgi:putative membrane-bound dehydrogenase-like protein
MHLPHEPIVQLTLCASLLLANGGTIQAQQTPDDSLATLQVADGVHVSLWASEPMVNNPTSMDVDSRGRVWISEGLNYRMKQRQFEKLKRIDKADRIKVLSDTDGDGKADKVTVFAENIFPVPLGLAVEEIWQDGKQTGTRVYVGNSPDLLVLEDIDGDDKADERYALLTGFRGVDSDHGLHGMTFGPDGKLYFTVGDARYGADRVQSREQTFDVTDKSGRRLSCSNFGTTLRVNRDGTQLEVLSSGHRNNYEAAVDSYGNVFGSDNDDDGNRGARMYWVMDGGQYGYQHPDSSRHWAEELPGIIPKLVGTGNGAPGGLTVYEGDLLPKRYFNSVLQIDSGTHQVNAHVLHRHGAGFRSDYKVLLKGDDSWFRPVDLAVAPDGSVLVCDWYDAGVGGNRFSDQTTGRIYRLSEVGSDDSRDQFDGKRPIAGLQSPNLATRLAARDSLVSMGASARRGLVHLFQNGRPLDRARALHVLHSLPGTGIDDTIAALSDRDPRIRETALQLLARDATHESVVEPAAARAVTPPATPFLDLILALANDPDAGVRRALLMAIRNVPTEAVSGALEQLAESWNGQDRYYLEALRAALIHRDSQYVQQLFDQLATRAIENGWNTDAVAVPPYYPIGTNDAFLRPADQLPPSNVASRVIGLAWGLQRPESLAALTRILKDNTSPTVEQAATIALAEIEDNAAGRLLLERFSAAEIGTAGKRRILHQLGIGVPGPWKSLAGDASFQKVLVAGLEDRSLQPEAIMAIARCRLSAFGDHLMNLAGDESNDSPIRAAAVSALGQLKHAPALTLVSELVNGASGKPSAGPIVQAALDASHALADPESGDILIQTLTDFAMPLDVRRHSLQLVTASSSGVDRVLSLRQQKSFPVDLENELAFLLHNHADRRVRDKAESVLPANTTEGTKKIHDARAVLALQGDPVGGRKLFETHKVAACARCHRVNGKGPLVGPDLASIGMKYGDKELLYHIQNPSGSINYSFVAHNFVLEDGRVMTGLVITRKDGQVTIGDATGKRVSFPASDVEEEVAQSISLMPDGLVSSLTTQQVSDLVEYLLTLRQGDAVSRASPSRQP